MSEAPYGKWIEQFGSHYQEKGCTQEEFKEKRVLHGIYKSLELCPRIEIREIEEGKTVQISIVGMFSNLPALKDYKEFQKGLSKLAGYKGVFLSQNLCVLEISKTDKGAALKYSTSIQNFPLE